MEFPTPVPVLASVPLPPVAPDDPPPVAVPAVLPERPGLELPSGAGLPWPRVLHAATSTAVLLAGLAAAGGAGWAVASARDALHGRLTAFAASVPHLPAAPAARTELADNSR
ncbi:MAG: hypothetical protein ACRYG6_10770 [Janthinobacterium lividum]